MVTVSAHDRNRAGRWDQGGDMMGRGSSTRGARIIGVVVLLYVGLVAGFESMLGYFQPAGQTSLVITTIEADGTAHDRVVAQYETDGQLYVSANHWPRAWYRRALANPDVRATVNGATRDYRAVPVTGDEHDRVEAAHPHGLVFRMLTGFPPRRVVRLDPR